MGIIIRFYRPVSCLLVLILIATAFARPAAAQEEQSPTLTGYETFLAHLYNGLIAEGLLKGDPVEDASGFWEKADADALAEALDKKLGKAEGGLVTASKVYSAQASYEVVSGDGANISLRLEGLSYPLQPRRGLADCQLVPVNEGTPSLHLAVGANLRCLFAEAVRATYLGYGESGGFVPPDLVPESGAEEAMTEYLEQLLAEGVITSYALDLAGGTVAFDLAGESSPSLPMVLPLSLVNPFPTLEAELESVKSGTAALLATHVFSLTPAGTVPYRRADLDLGLAAMAKQTGPEKRAQAFFEAAGLGDLIPGWIRPFLPCTYPAGVVTPCNNELAVLWGADNGAAFHPGVDGFNEIQGALAGYGYKKSEINAQCRFSPGDETLFRALRRAQTLIFNVHGGNGGFQSWQCYPGVEALEEAGPTRECCEALKRTASELGIPGAGGMNCSLPAVDRPQQTPGGELRIDSTYEGGCPCAPAPPANRCTILGTNNALVSMGPKAAVFTSQCYGGQCPAAPGIAGAVMDLMTQTSFSNYPAPEKCDDKRVSLDLKGQATYCRDTTPATPDREPWKGPATGQCTGGAAIGLMPGAPSGLRTLEGSLSTRGSWANGWIRSCRTVYNTGGWEQLNAANLGGSPDTLVEFAPAVASADFTWWTGLFSASFTSALKPGCRVQVELSGDTRKTISTNPVATTATCGPGGVTVQLSGDPAWMSPFDWARPAAELQAIYGADQSSWPWYIKIRITNAAAPNGTKLVGNQGATRKWIWASPMDPSPVPPYLHSSGMFSQGGSTYEVWIPVPPSMACCMPNIEWTSPQGGGEPVPRQNGCTCAGGVGKDFCFAGTCVVCDENGFCGNWSYPGMNPADCPGTYRRFDGTWHLWHDCCPVAVNGENRCEATVVEITPPPNQCEPGDSGHYSWTWYQHIARPWDTNGPQRCEPIEGLWYCAEH